MSAYQQEIAHSEKTKNFLEEGVLAGVGVLLVFLGVFSTVPLTNVLAVGIGAFLFYAAVEVYRGKNLKKTSEEVVDGDSTLGVEQTTGDNVLVEPTTLSLKLPEQQHYVDRHSDTDTQAISDNRKTVSDAMAVMETKTEFNSLLVSVLTALKDFCFAHTVAFFWINHDAKQLVVEAKITDSSSFITERKIPLGTDIVSTIGISGEPKIINAILAETEQNILCYYKSLQEVKSFIGVPVFYSRKVAGEKPIGIIAVDSKAEDAYGDETFSVLHHFSRLISALLVNYTEKDELYVDAKIVAADWKLKRKLLNKPSIPVAVNSLTEELENIIPWDSMSVVLFDEALRGWALASVHVRANDKFLAPKQLIDFDNSIIGTSIKTNTVQTVHLAHNTQIIFSDSEKSYGLLKQGELVTVPFSSGGKCYGAVVVTNKTPNTFSKKDIFAIEFLSSTIAPLFESAELNVLLNEHLAVDELTGVWTKKFFLLRLNDELQRANDRDEDLTIALVALSNVSDIEHRYGVEGKEAALASIAQRILGNVRQYDVVGRYDATTFAVVLADTIASDAYLWAEKLRTAIASSIVTVERRSFSISVTIGVSGATAKMSSADLLHNATLVLEQAKKAGGNIVRVF